MSTEQMTDKDRVLLNIQGKIDEILMLRQKKAKELEEKRAVVQKLYDTFSQSLELTGLLRKIDENEVRGACASKLRVLELCQKDVDRFLKGIDEVINRFKRDYVSIATIGQERQGKSRVLQSIGNLNNDVIPAYEGSSCTGAVSVIWNKPDMEPRKVKAVISFKKEEELLESVNAYVKAIDPSMTLSFDDLSSGVYKRNVLSLLEKIVDDEKNIGNLNMSIAFTHLKTILDKFDEISGYCGKEDIILYDENKIKTFVAQNNGKKIGEPGYEGYFNFLAVKRADIYCRFYNNIGRVRLVDTVGIGDTKVGIEDAMLNTIKNECDAAIVIKKSDGGLQEQDQKLYNQLRENFKDRDTANWLFYLSNWKKGTNDVAAEAFAKDILNSNMAIANRSSDYRSLVVDASDPEALYEIFMIPLIQKILENFGEINSSYIRQLEEQGNSLIKMLEEKLDEIKVDDIDVENDMGKEAFLLGCDSFAKISSQLHGQVMRWEREKDNPNGELFKRVKIILDNIYDLIPSADQLQHMYQNTGAVSKDGTWEIALNIVRNSLTDRFIELDEVLEEATKEFKNSLVSVIYESLHSLTSDKKSNDENSENDVDMIEWLLDVIKIIDVKPEYSQIIKALKFIYSFEFNTRAQIIQTVRQQLYVINPICDEYAKPMCDFHNNTIGEEIYYYLTSRISVVEENIRYMMLSLYRTPNQAFYAAAEEFYDRLTFSSDLNDLAQVTDMSKVWGQFFQDFYTVICSENTEWKKVLKDFVNRLKLFLENINGQLEVFPFRNKMEVNK